MLREHFPACFKADGSFDIEHFKAEIAAAIYVVQEGYELKFLGKSYAMLLASTETTKVIQQMVSIAGIYHQLAFREKNLSANSASADFQ